MGKIKRMHLESFWEMQEKITLVDIGKDGSVIWRKRCKIDKLMEVVSHDEVL
jgi:hypothetical protein